MSILKAADMDGLVAEIYSSFASFEATHVSTAFRVAHSEMEYGDPSRLRGTPVLYRGDLGSSEFVRFSQVLFFLPSAEFFYFLPRIIELICLPNSPFQPEAVDAFLFAEAVDVFLFALEGVDSSVLSAEQKACVVKFLKSLEGSVEFFNLDDAVYSSVLARWQSMLSAS